MVPTRHAASLGVTHFLGLGQAEAEEHKLEGEGRPSYPFFPSGSSWNGTFFGKITQLPHTILFYLTVIPAVPPPDSCPYNWPLLFSTLSFGLAGAGISVSVPRFCLPTPNRPPNTGMVHRECSTCFWNTTELTPVYCGDCTSDGLNSYPSSTMG